MKVPRLLSCLLILSALCCAQTYTFSTLLNFPKLANPWSPPIVDGQGNLYGVASGGTYKAGIVYKVTPKGALSTLYNFRVSDGDATGAVLARDSSGNLYGMSTGQGGAQGWGIIFKISPAGKRTVLYKFPANSYPPGSDDLLARDTAGNLYGYLYLPPKIGTSPGSLFKLTPAGVFSVLYTFCSQADCTDGTGPVGGPLLDKSGNIYGAAGGGTFNCGVIFKITSSGKESVLYNFTGGTDGDTPSGKLTQDASGNKYGGTMSGGAFNSNGVAFKIDTNNNETVLYSFSGDPSAGAPYGPVIPDAQGNVYGIASGGPNGDDVAYEISLGQLTILHSFGSELSAWGLAKDNSGNLYGVSPYGGTKQYGSVYKLTKTN